MTSTTEATVSSTTAIPTVGDLIGRSVTSGPDAQGFFGEFGGRYIPEALMAVFEEISAAWEHYRVDADYQRELNDLQARYAGRPSPLYEALAFSRHAGCRVFLKREDLNHTGSHKINNVLGQVLLAKKMGKTRVIAETGAGQHGVATATACALLGLDCVIYMGAVDTRRQALNVARMKLLGAEVKPVETGSATLKDAINEALRDWVSHADETYYAFGTAAGPHPFPAMVRELQRIIGAEAQWQLEQENDGLTADAVMACVGGGSNAIGLFAEFIDQPDVRLIGVEAGGDGVETGRHSAPISTLTTPGVFQGAFASLMQDEDGQIIESHSISAGLDYPGVGPQHSYLHAIGRAEYIDATDAEAMEAFALLTKTEGIIPAIESAHALAGALKIGPQLGADGVLVVCVSGRGDKDVATAARWFDLPEAEEQ